MNIYCVKCRTKTKNAGKGQIVTTRNNRKMAQCLCSKCGTKKSQFIAAGQKGSGFVGDLFGDVLGIAGTAAGAYANAPILGSIAGRVTGGLARKLPF